MALGWDPGSCPDPTPATSAGGPDSSRSSRSSRSSHRRTRGGLSTWLLVIGVSVGVCGGIGLLTGCAGPSGPGGPATASGTGRASSARTDALIQSLDWVQRDDVRALRVVPTEKLREGGLSVDAERAWQEVLARVPQADRPGMFNQFRCHATFAAHKRAWYLEPSRPNVGYLDTVLAGCNPGAIADVG